RARQLRQRGAIVGSVVAVIAIGVGAYFWASSGSGAKPAAAATSKPSATPSASSTPSAPASLPPATPAATVPTTPPKVAPASHCTYTANPPAARKVSFPSSTPDSSAKSQ